MNPEQENMELDKEENEVIEENEVFEDESMENGSDSDSDEEEDEEHSRAKAIENINRIQDELSVNKYDYNKHEELIKIIRSLGEMDLIRDARNQMHQLFPLSESIWQQWIEDELALGTDGIGVSKITELFEKALNDYISAEIWLEYCQYVCANKNLDEIRTLLERALQTIGSHFLFGRNFYKLAQKVEREELEKTTKNLDREFQYYLNLYERQFSFPLKNMDTDLDELKEFLDRFNEKHPNIIDYTKQLSRIEELFGNNLLISQFYQDFEDRIVKEANDRQKRLIVYGEYLAHLMNMRSNHHESIVCLFERAVADCYNDATIWKDYLMYCDNKINSLPWLKKIYERALRNVPWSAEVWTRYLYFNFRYFPISEENPIVKAQEYYTKAIQNQFATVDDYKNVTLAYLCCLKRLFTKLDFWKKEDVHESIREAFQKPIDSFCVSYGDEDCYEMKKFQAIVEAKYLGSKEKGNDIYQNLSEKYKNYASFWIDWASFARDFDSEKEYREILIKGLHSSTDYQDTIAEMLLKYNFEVEDDFEKMIDVEANIKTMKRNADIRKAREEKRKRALRERLSANNKDKTPTKKRENDGSKPEENNKKQSPQAKKQKKEIVDNGKHGVTVQTDPLKVSQTVFLSNLSFDVEEDEIKNEFSKFGEINEVRLVRNFKGNSKGYCYVEFKDPLTVHEALKHDRMMIHGRPVFISEMDKKSGFSYSLNAEKNKLFVKNIPLSYTKDDVINKIFTEFSDSIKDVRLVTYRNGFSKGWAYVEMKDEDTANKAVEAKNDQEYEDRKLFVAISDPSKSAKSTSNDRPFQGRGAPTQAGIVPTNPKMKFGSTNFMIPTSVRLKNMSQKPGSGATPSTSGIQESIAGPTRGNLSNDQFRSFLTKN